MMTIDERIVKVLSEVLSVPSTEISDNFSMDSAEQWSSLGHLSVVLGLEEEFHVQFTDQEAVELLSFKLIRATLNDKGIA